MPSYCTNDKNWDLQDFLNLTPTEEVSSHEQRRYDLNVFLGKRELTNIESEDKIQNAVEHQETPVVSDEVEEDKPISRKRRRTATDCRVEWRAGISSEKAAIIEKEDQITEEEMRLRERYGELKGVVRTTGMFQDCKDKDNFKDIFKNGKEDLLNAKKEITEVIVKEKEQQATKVGKINKKKGDGSEAFDIAKIRKQTLAEDIRVSLENCFCSKLYLIKLKAYSNSQERYLTHLRTQISILTDGIIRTCENKETLQEILGKLRQVQGDYNENNTNDEVIFTDVNQKKVNYKYIFNFNTYSITI